MTGRGLLVPEWYVSEPPTEADMNVSSVFWGFSLGIALFSAGQAAKQTRKSWQRSSRITAYVAMIWVNWMSSVVIGAISWCFQRGYIQPSFWFFFFVAFFWVFQIQLLLQIIINRVGLLMAVRHQATRLKWVVFLIILVINISVFIIWIPARLQINQTWININNIWDRCEKVIFCLVDIGLNIYFLRLTRNRLINNGLTKYVPLYKANLVLVCISMSLDVILIGLMSLPSGLVYLQFHPVAYLLKLQIEMVMADLITKIVRATSVDGGYSSGIKSKTSGVTTSRVGKKSSSAAPRGQNLTFVGQQTTTIGVGDHDRDIEMEDRKPQDRVSPQPDAGIRKTVETVINREPREEERDIDDASSQTSSTRKLHYHYGFKPTD
ncbi:Fc.00g073710.m01.CDS01 [Cosmosporella sp. VM-42]